MDIKALNNRLKKAIIIIIIIALILLATSVSLRIYLKSMVKETIAAQVNDATEKYVSLLKKEIQNDFQILESYSSIFEFDDVANSEAFNTVIEATSNNNHFFSMMYVNQNKEIMAATINDKQIDTVSFNMVQTELQELINTTLNGNESMSSLFDSKIIDNSIYAYGIPIFNHGKVTGALIATETVDLMMDVGAENGILGGDTYVYIVDQDGNIIINSKYDQFKQNNILGKPYLKRNEIKQTKDAMQNQKDVSFSFDYNDNNYIAKLEPVGINNWYLLSVNMLENSSLFISENVRIIGILFISIIVLVIGLLIYGYRISLKNNRELARYAYYDPLTGAYNFLYFKQQGKQAFIKDNKCSIVVLNIRQFKFFNEIFGNDQGDKLLTHIKNAIEANLKENEFCCRDTADQFYLFLSDNQRDVIQKRIEKMTQEIVSLNDLLHTNYHLKIQCGVAISTDQEEQISFDNLMVRVMFALAKAKENMQTSIWFYDEKLHKQEKMDNYIESHMNQALKDNEFKFFLQPKISLKDNSLQSAEALVRWKTSDGQFIFPNQFIPIFEKSGFCVELDMYMFEQACKQIRNWIDQGIEPIGISVNQSKLLFYEADYVERLHRLVDQYQISPKLITLEILEDLVIDNVEEVNNKIKSLHKIGFQVSLDDFGTGYSSLNILGKLDIDELKLDKGFLQEVFVENNFRTRIIIEEIVNLAKILSISTVVEGVETKECNDFIKKIGCDFGQGYLYDRPISIKEFNQKYFNSKENSH